MVAFSNRLFSAGALALAALAGLAAGEPCNIAGFEEFCQHWNSCTVAPYEAAASNGKCLYGRAISFGKADNVSNLALAGAYRRVMFIQGPDAVTKAAGRHCTAEGRGRMLLNLGWVNPSVNTLFSYNVFVRPCASMLGAPPSNPWTPESAPVSADWQGVRSALKVAYGSNASLQVWDDLSVQYSYAGGGLGPTGLTRYNVSFLEACSFGSYTSAGCCKNTTSVPETFLNLSNAFSDLAAQPSANKVAYTDAAVLRAFLSNSMGLNAFFNGDGRTFDGCTGHYSIVSNTEYLMPNKHSGAWDNAADRVLVGEVTQANNGFSFIWGPPELCTNSTTPCHAEGTVLSKSGCETSYGTYPTALTKYIFGGAVTPCSGRSLTEVVATTTSLSVSGAITISMTEWSLALALASAALALSF